VTKSQPLQRVILEKKKRKYKEIEKMEAERMTGIGGSAEKCLQLTYRFDTTVETPKQRLMTNQDQSYSKLS
jgi:hypothetical protein